MRRKLTTLTKAITLTAIAAMAMSIPAFAGSWRADGERWWYDNGDGTWAKTAGSGSTAMGTESGKATILMPADTFWFPPPRRTATP